MLKLFEKVSKSMISRCLSSNNEVMQISNDNSIVLSSLPKNILPQKLIIKLSTIFSSGQADVKTDILGRPALATLSFPSENELKQALSKSEIQIQGKKVHLKVIPKQSLNEFISQNSPLESGHDSRKILITNIPLTWNKDKIYSIFSTVGSIMNLELPFDYDFPLQFPDGENILKKIIDQESIDMSIILPTGNRQLNLFIDFRKHVITEFECLDLLLQTKHENPIQIIKELVILYKKICKFKDLTGLAPSDKEEKINITFSKTKTKTEIIKLKNMIEEDFNDSINEFFYIKGYAKITYATRKQAERSIILSEILKDEIKGISSFFDRNIPDYLYTTSLLAEAKLRENYKVKSLVEGITDVDKKMKYHKKIFDVIIKNYIRQRDESIGFELNTDDKNDNIEIEGENIIKEISYKSSEDEENSLVFIDRVKGSDSDDDYNFDIEKIEINPPGTGRVYNKKMFFKKQMMKNYMISLRERHIINDDTNDMISIPEVEHPRDLPSVHVWSSNKDKIQAKQKLVSYGQLFKSQIPQTVLDNPMILIKEKHIDFPHIRFAYIPEFDYFKTPYEDFNKDIKKNHMHALRFKIRDIKSFSPDDLIDKNEEIKILNEKKNFNMFSDEDEDQQGKDIENYNEKEMGNRESFGTGKNTNEVLIPENYLVKTKKFKYDGEDVGEYVKKLNQIQGMEAEYSKNEAGETIVYVVCKPKYDIDVEELKMLYKKYGNEIASGNEEIEIDEEDQDGFRRLMDLGIDLRELFEEIKLFMQEQQAVYK
ncbi:hypothetical protein SteCoe_1968 [Stentor coeruleus]|uniref:RRM domain-containing protein n=1 Tax=Stentor coeruleus TaxID=5963 RepID=A0A1R2D0K2_9CILI|nr:hypothetical protein SteCoe_1968 [Stentor coeruleus]